MTKRAALVWLEADLRRRLARAESEGNDDEAFRVGRRIEYVEGLLRDQERRLSSCLTRV